ncbi:hypothetical protein GH733_008633 [Mirounga leonina]|nr:hypothetical protein GH733_008633 [Mirounga leonina]
MQSAETLILLPNLLVQVLQQWEWLVLVLVLEQSLAALSLVMPETLR